MKNNALEDEVNKLVIEKNKLATEVKLNKEDLHAKMIMANQENKVLRSTNTSLQEQLSKTREEKNQESTKIEKILNFVCMVDEAVKEGSADVEELVASQSVAEDTKVKKIQEAIHSLLVENNGLKAKRKYMKTVKFATSEAIHSLLVENNG